MSPALACAAAAPRHRRWPCIPSSVMFLVCSASERCEMTEICWRNNRTRCERERMAERKSAATEEPPWTNSGKQGISQIAGRAGTTTNLLAIHNVVRPHDPNVGLPADDDPRATLVFHILRPVFHPEPPRPPPETCASPTSRSQPRIGRAYASPHSSMTEEVCHTRVDCL